MWTAGGHENASRLLFARSAQPTDVLKQDCPGILILLGCSGEQSWVSGRLGWLFQAVAPEARLISGF